MISPEQKSPPHITHEYVPNPDKQFEIHPLTDPLELHEARVLRAHVYIEEAGFLEPSERDSDGGEHDVDDSRSIHYGVYENREQTRHLVGTSRLIVKNSESEVPLPIEHHFGVYAPNGSVEASRLVVETDKRAKESQLLVSLALMRSMIHTAQDMKAPFIYAVVEPGLYQHFLRIGLPAEQIADEVSVQAYNSENIAVRFKTDTIIDSVWQKDTDFVQRDEFGVRTTRYPRLGQFFSEKPVYGKSTLFGFNDITHPRAGMFTRNLGFLRPEEQEVLGRATVAIAGAGGDGGLLAEQIVRSGVGSIRLADPENFDVENINRQAHSNFKELGRNKAEVVAEALLRINPWLDVEVYSEGIHEDNIERFVRGSDLIIDETEFTMPELGTMINRSARKYGTGVLMAMNIGFGAQVTSFVPGRGKSFESWLGIPEDMPLDEVKDLEVPISRWLGHLPSYVDIEVFAQVTRGEISAPSLTGGVALASGIASEQAIRHLIGGKGTKRPSPVIAPGAIVVDPVDGMKVLRHTKIGFYTSMASLVLRNKLGLVPKIVE
jgi:molybdopterin/thiamine biosynthesis adenylyltransferase/N-acyl-L-homoserine lactone synthetase